MGNFIESILSGGIKGLAEGIGTLAKDIRTAITGQTPLDPNKQAELLMQLEMYEAAARKAAADYDTTQMQGQIEIAKIEAASPSLWKGGWRPATGWVCALGLFYTFLVRPILPWVVSVSAGAAGYVADVPPMPGLDMETLIFLLAGMLGLGTMRTFEKIKGAR